MEDRGYKFSEALSLCAMCVDPLMFYEEDCVNPCGNNLYLLSDIQKNIHNCVDSCPRDFYEDTVKKLCLECKWNPDLNLVRYEDGSCQNSKCLPYMGYFRQPSSNICFKCHEDCLECSGPNNYQCIKCNSGSGLSVYNSEGGSECQSCANECNHCSPYYYKDCVACKPEHVLVEKKVTLRAATPTTPKIDRKIKECKANFECQFDEILKFKASDETGSYECEQCSSSVNEYGSKNYPNCLTCNSTSCVSCKNNYYPVYANTTDTYIDNDDMVKQDMNEEGNPVLDYCKCVSSQQVYQVAEWRVGRQVHQEYLYCKSYNENMICQCYPECDPVAMVGNKCQKSKNLMVLSNMLN
jgi:hypothetical protein